MDSPYILLMHEPMNPVVPKIWTRK